MRIVSKVRLEAYTFDCAPIERLRRTHSYLSASRESSSALDTLSFRARASATVSLCFFFFFLGGGEGQVSNDV